jgi:Na+/H+ antiporter NhaD/arsenite permease-like protein
MTQTAEPAFPVESVLAAASPALAGIPTEFFLFGLTLIGVALFHDKVLQVALSGLVAISAFKLFFTDFDMVAHAQHEWELLFNLFGLLIGFEILAGYFSMSKVPDWLPRILPDDWKGAFTLLVLIFVMSGFLDNIAAAIIGGTIAGVVFKGRVHIGYLAAIVASSNAGGAGSVVGDTTTTMIWLAGASPSTVAPAYLAAAVALLSFGVLAAKQQHRHQPIQKDPVANVKIDGAALGVVALILAGAILANVYLGHRPVIGVWAAILLAAPFRRADWHHAPAAAKGAAFLVSLVLCASMMPVESLPAASWTTAFGLGFVSSVFDNIPLTKLAIDQGGYDWALLAYCVGFGGSMVWFGSSAGVAISNKFPEAKSVGAWIKNGWFVIVAYVIGFFAMYLALGWNPSELARPD